jgi:hypothetical protein
VAKGGRGGGSSCAVPRDGEGMGPRPDRRVTVAGSNPLLAGASGTTVRTGEAWVADVWAPATVPGLNPVKLGQNRSNEIEFKY